MKKKFFAFGISFFIALQGALFAQTTSFEVLVDENFNSGSPQPGSQTFFSYWRLVGFQGSSGQMVIDSFPNPNGSSDLTYGGGGGNNINNNTGDFRVYGTTAFEANPAGTSANTYNFSFIYTNDRTDGANPTWRARVIDEATGASQQILGPITSFPIGFNNERTASATFTLPSNFNNVRIFIENTQTNSNGNDWRIDDIRLTRTSTIIPEPSSALLLGGSLLGLLRSRRRRV